MLKKQLDTEVIGKKNLMINYVVLIHFELFHLRDSFTVGSIMRTSIYQFFRRRCFRSIAINKKKANTDDIVLIY